MKSCARLWAGWSPRRSGVRSAGNGASMRAPILGVYFWDQPERLRKFVDASTQMTHCDPRAVDGAWLIAVAASIAVRDIANRATSPETIFAELIAASQTAELREALQLAEAAHRDREPLQTLATRLGCHDRVNGFICHTVPVVILAWLVHRADYRAAVESVIQLGGDTDTHAALVGALRGISAGVAAIPSEWRSAVVNWPRTMGSVHRLAARPRRKSRCARYAATCVLARRRRAQSVNIDDRAGTRLPTTTAAVLSDCGSSSPARNSGR